MKAEPEQPQFSYYQPIPILYYNSSALEQKTSKAHYDGYKPLPPHCAHIPLPKKLFKELLPRVKTPPFTNKSHYTQVPNLHLLKKLREPLRPDFKQSARDSSKCVLVKAKNYQQIQKQSSCKMSTFDQGQRQLKDQLKSVDTKFTPTKETLMQQDTGQNKDQFGFIKSKVKLNESQTDSIQQEIQNSVGLNRSLPKEINNHAIKDIENLEKNQNKSQINKCQNEMNAIDQKSIQQNQHSQDITAKPFKKQKRYHARFKTSFKIRKNAANKQCLRKWILSELKANANKIPQLHKRDKRLQQQEIFSNLNNLEKYNINQTFVQRNLLILEGVILNRIDVKNPNTRLRKVFQKKEFHRKNIIKFEDFIKQQK